MKKYIKHLLLFVILLQTTNFANAKEPVLVTDSILAETMLRTYTKLLFFENAFFIKYYIEEKGGNISYKQFPLYMTNKSTIGFGSWAEMPEYFFEKGQYKSPWKGYDIYTLKVPRGTKKNNYIVAKFLDNARDNNVIFYPTDEVVLAYNAKKTKSKIYMIFPEVLFRRRMISLSSRRRIHNIKEYIQIQNMKKSPFTTQETQKRFSQN